ncbi:MAG: MarR family transcriptional regulator [Alphaproteobacteria bacterium]|nr:MarR family transcriptional regulator [Alphaproteobacteria bacterium]
MAKEKFQSEAGLPSDNIYLKVLTEIDMIAHMAGVAFQKFLPDGLTDAQFGVLNRLMRLDTEETVGELAAAFQVTQPTMSSTVGRLVEKGYAEFLPDASDRRIKRVRATSSGRKLRNQTVAKLEPFYAVFEEEAGDVDWKSCLAALTVLRGHFERKRDGGGL